jgi:hypothetical protein
LSTEVCGFGDTNLRGCGEVDPDGDGDQCDLNPEEADRFQSMLDIVTSLKDARAILRDANNHNLVLHLDNAIHNEQRRHRQMRKTDPKVAAAMFRRRDEEVAELTADRQRHAELVRQRRETKRLKAEAAAADAKLKQAQKDIKDATAIKETHASFKSFTLGCLGDGAKKNAGGAAGRKARHQVLDRLSKYGCGLSAEQRNDWLWFKSEVDQRMLAAHGAEWPSMFAGCVQHVLDALEAGVKDAFTRFVQDETNKFDGVLAVRL